MLVAGGSCLGDAPKVNRSPRSQRRTHACVHIHMYVYMCECIYIKDTYIYFFAGS